MKIVISAFGTRGDVQPMLAIALHAIKKGHEVLMVVCRGTEHLLEKKGVPYVLYGGSTAQELFGILGSGIKTNSVILKNVTSHMEIQARELPLLCKDADVLMGNSLDTMAPSVAEFCNIPYMRTLLTPIFKGDGRPTTLPLQSLSKRMNTWMWKLGMLSWEFLLKPKLNEARKHLSLKPISNYYKHTIANPTLLCLDDRLAPSSMFWPDNVYYSGYPFMQTQERLPEYIRSFIDTGEAPIYIGFGSMGSADSLKVTEILVSAIKKSKARAIISKGWANLGGVDLPENIIEVDNVCHNLLFPQMSGIVHHGGAGTTHTAALAGKPQLVIPHITDQFYYGQSVFENQLGPKPIHFNKLNAKNLTLALIDLKKEAFKTKATLFGDLMKLDGANSALNKIEHYIKSQLKSKKDRNV